MIFSVLSRAKLIRERHKKTAATSRPVFRNILFASLINIVYHAGEYPVFNAMKMEERCRVLSLEWKCLSIWSTELQLNSSLKGSQDYWFCIWYQTMRTWDGSTQVICDICWLIKHVVRAQVWCHNMRRSVNIPRNKKKWHGWAKEIDIDRKSKDLTLISGVDRHRRFYIIR